MVRAVRTLPGFFAVKSFGFRNADASGEHGARHVILRRSESDIPATPRVPHGATPFARLPAPRPRHRPTAPAPDIIPGPRAGRNIIHLLPPARPLQIPLTFALTTENLLPAPERYLALPVS